MTRNHIKRMAIEHGWTPLQSQDYMLSFKREEARVNVYYTKMTVATCINHPKHGKTQLFRKKVKRHQLRRIFRDPRAHTGKGYYAKSQVATNLYLKNTKKDQNIIIKPKPKNKISFFNKLLSKFLRR